MRLRRIFVSILIPLFLFTFLPITKQAEALSVDELKAQIEAKLKEKAALDAENEKLKKEIEAANKEAQSLQSAVKALDSTQKKLQTDIKVTQNKIYTTELSIKKIGIEILTTEEKIEQNKEAMSEALRTLHQVDDSSFVQNLLQYKNIAELWDAVETLRRFQSSVKQKTNELSGLTQTLKGQKVESEKNKENLTEYKGELSDREKIVDQNKQVKSTLLTQTKNKEAEYQEQLKRNIELGKKFEQELFQFESQLRAQIDESKLPTAREGVLAWPLDDVYITQRFGRTVDSQRLYVSGTHNGVDFRAAMGSPIYAVADGVVKGVGNTDAQPGCYSYGRWLLIEHPNGLSSMYAHLSGLKATTGQTVKRGEVVAYSGGQPGTSGAGYSTGPHLHLGIFASEGVKINQYSQSNFCKQVSIPIAQGLNAYLDPLAYLPPLN